MLLVWMNTPCPHSVTTGDPFKKRELSHRLDPIEMDPLSWVCSLRCAPMHSVHEAFAWWPGRFSEINIFFVSADRGRCSHICVLITTRNPTEASVQSLWSLNIPRRPAVVGKQVHLRDLQTKGGQELVDSSTSHANTQVRGTEDRTTQAVVPQSHTLPACHGTSSVDHGRFELQRQRITGHQEAWNC